MNGLLRVRRKSSQVCFLDTWQHLFSPVMLTLLYVELLSPEAIAHFICSSKMRLQIFRVSYNLFHFNVFWFVFFCCCCFITSALVFVFQIKFCRLRTCPSFMWHQETRSGFLSPNWWAHLMKRIECHDETERTERMDETNETGWNGMKRNMIRCVGINLIIVCDHPIF